MMQSKNNTFDTLLELTKLTENIHNDIDIRLSFHIREVVNLTGVDSGIRWLHVVYYYRGVSGCAGSRGRLKPVLVRFRNDILSSLIVIDLKANVKKSTQ